MRTFEQSEKSSKTVASMIVFRNKKPVERTDRKQQANKKSLHTSHIQPEPVIKHLNGSVVFCHYAHCTRILFRVCCSGRYVRSKQEKTDGKNEVKEAEGRLQVVYLRTVF